MYHVTVSKPLLITGKFMAETWIRSALTKVAEKIRSKLEDWQETNSNTGGTLPTSVRLWSLLKSDLHLTYYVQRYGKRSMYKSMVKK